MSNDIEALARQADPGFSGAPQDPSPLSSSLCGLDAIRRFAALVAEECAKIAEAGGAEGRAETDQEGDWLMPADAIRDAFPMPKGATHEQ